MAYGNASVTLYPDGARKIVVSLSRPFSYGEKRPVPSRLNVDGGRASVVSRKRTVSHVYDICRSNAWDWFCTLTFDKTHVDRYCYDACAAEIIRFTAALRYRGIQYLFVPEVHKDGAFHFHGLLAGTLSVPRDISPSGHWDTSGREIFNLSIYDVGFSTVSRVSDSGRASGYLAKYLVKAEPCVPPGRKRYWASRGLSRPERFVVSVSDADIVTFSVAASYMKEIDNQYGRYLVYDIPAG